MTTRYLESGADVSHDTLYRYRLTRRWDVARPCLVVIGLNPSTADATQDDHTIRRCVALARRDGFGELEMLNLFAFHATDPRELALQDHYDPPRNLQTIENICRSVPRVMAAWGAHRSPAIDSQIERVRAAANAILWCWGKTKDGAPRHPSRLSNSVAVEPWP